MAAAPFSGETNESPGLLKFEIKWTCFCLFVQNETYLTYFIKKLIGNPTVKINTVNSQIFKDIQSIGNPTVKINIVNSQIFKDIGSCSEKVTIQKLRDNVILLKVLRKGKSWTQQHAFLEKR